MDVFDRPLRDDWLTWLAGAAVVLGLVSSLGDPAIDPGANAVAAVVDASMWLVTYWLMLVVIPAGARSGLRLVRSRWAAEQTGSGDAGAA